ncbi:MAG TPA: MFS transporter [Burkholderiales bacterium]|nr:MFS transporter [Burkholderiales bacterium]
MQSREIPRLEQHLLLALGAMFFQQTFVALGRALPAVIAPAIITDLHLDAAWIGVYFGVMALSALISQLGCGSFIVRYGALRVSQIALLMLAVGMGLAALGSPLPLLLSAVIAGGGGAVSTPASSHLLSRCTSLRYLPLVFSIKQTAVPAGLLLAGMLGPPLTEWMDWRATMLACGAACAILFLVLQPLRKIFDTDRIPTRSFRLSDFKSTLTVVLATPRLRALSFACLAFNGVQAVFTAYFVTYLTTIGYTPVAAGFLFSVAVAVAVPGRILWGWIGSSFVAPSLVMAGLALGMAGSAALLALSGAGWPVVLVGLVACVLSATALSWHGVLLAETATASPEDMRGGVTGGVLSFGQVGALILPLTYSGFLDLTGSYGIGFIACGLPALLVGVQLLRRRSPAQR